MTRTSESLIYILTYQDVQRIRAILSTVDDAIDELINYRRLDPIDPRANFPCENAVYEQTSNIMREVMDMDILF